VTVSKFPDPGKNTKADKRFNLVDNPELIGLCRGVLADGSINLAEAEYIQRWLGERRNLLDTWPAGELYKLLSKVLKDGVLNPGEEQELSDMLEEVIGDPVSLLLY
jgi:hypothetical protein